MNIYAGNTNDNPLVSQTDISLQTMKNMTAAEMNDIFTLIDTGTADAKELLKSLMVGDIFTASVTGLNGNNITLSLANGAQVTATLITQTDLSIGQNLTFMINENTDSKISIKPLQMNEQEKIVITKALEASNLQLNPKNIRMIKELLGQNMSVRSDALLTLSRQQARYPDTDIRTLVRLTKLGIPINNENIKQFEAYSSFKNSIATDLSQMSTHTGEIFSNSLNEQGAAKTLELSKNFIQILYPEPAYHTDWQDGYLPQNIKQNFIQVLKTILPSDTAHRVLQEVGTQQIPVKTFLLAVSQLLQEEKTGSKELHKLFQSREFHDMIHYIIRDRMKISPEDVREAEHVKEYYTRVHEMTNQMSEHVLHMDKSGEFGKHLENIKNNIEFMNELNKNMSYFQLPVKLSSGDTETELYVFTNKKKRLQSKEAVSALLHLNMEHLGDMDVFVKLADKNVKAEFYLENEEILTFLDKHMKTFVENMEKSGYQIHTGLQVKEKEKPTLDFIEDFIDYGNSSRGMGQFLFDTKA